MSELWSGLLGAIIGAVLAAGASFLTVRWQTSKMLDDERQQAKDARDQERQDARRLREEQALANLLLPLNAVQENVHMLYALPAVKNTRFLATARAEDRPAAKFVYDALMHGLRVDLPLITNPEIKTRYWNLVRLVDELGTFGGGTGIRDRQRSDVVRYVEYVRLTIKNALHETALPAEARPPVLTRTDEALWTPPETDPEDTYFPEPVT